MSGPDLVAPERSVVLVDGMFLHRPELAGIWDASVFLDVSFETSCRRMEIRNGSDPDPEAESNRRYVHGQRLYFSACDPRSIAGIVIDNNDFAAPRITSRSDRKAGWAAVSGSQWSSEDPSQRYR